MIIIKGFKKDYVIHTETVRNLERAIIEELFDRYSTDEGKTTFQGQSVSFLAGQIRRRGFVLPGLECDQLELYKALGFDIVKARGVRTFRNGRIGVANHATVVTI